MCGAEFSPLTNCLLSCIVGATSKKAVKRRVSFRIGPFREPGKVQAGRIQETENGLGAARAKNKSSKSATGTPVKASGCTRSLLRRSFEGRFPRGGGKTRWYHGSFFTLPSLAALPREDGGVFPFPPRRTVHAGSSGHTAAGLYSSRPWADVPPPGAKQGPLCPAADRILYTAAFPAALPGLQVPHDGGAAGPTRKRGLPALSQQ